MPRWGGHHKRRDPQDLLILVPSRIPRSGWRVKTLLLSVNMQYLTQVSAQKSPCQGRLGEACPWALVGSGRRGEEEGYRYTNVRQSSSLTGGWRDHTRYTGLTGFWWWWDLTVKPRSFTLNIIKNRKGRLLNRRTSLLYKVGTFISVLHLRKAVFFKYCLFKRFSKITWLVEVGSARPQSPHTRLPLHWSALSAERRLVSGSPRLPATPTSCDPLNLYMTAFFC